MAMVHYPRSERSSRHTSRTKPESYYSEPDTYPPRSSAASSVYSSAPTAMTFGDRTKEGYTPRQAPADYYHSRKAQVAWETAARTPDGVKIRSYGFEEGYVSSRSGSSGSSRRGDSWYGESPESSPERYQRSTYEGTVVPEDSISQVSSYRSGGSRRSGSGAYEGGCYEGAGASRASERSGSRAYEADCYENAGVSRTSGRSRRSGKPVAVDYTVVERRPSWA